MEKSLKNHGDITWKVCGYPARENMENDGRKSMSRENIGGL